ncbi:MAG TPA: hypothetical protein PLY73_06015 [Candidatus Ozemobacteraceae bacterium]|nr:hypothetical protein [Candidatus Ozemobacteraceae bacterium]
MNITPVRFIPMCVLLLLTAADPAFSQDLKVTEEMITRYLAVYDTVTASNPAIAYRLFHHETLDPATPEGAMAEAALKQAGFESQQEFSAADVILGTAWLQLTAEEMAKSAERTKRDAVTAIEDALADPNLEDAQRNKLEQALERMQQEERPTATASDTDLIDSDSMALVRSYRDRLRPIMTMDSDEQLKGF